MRRIVLSLLILVSIGYLSYRLFVGIHHDESLLVAMKRENQRDLEIPVEHALFEVLDQEFKDVREVTAACLTCHNGRGNEVMKTSHFQWIREEFVEGRGVIKLGKKNVINNFCIGVAGNEHSSMKCHAGFGWEDHKFDFADERNVDCLICHDQSGEYVKGNKMAGLPSPVVNLQKVAKEVGRPSKANCGSCHFFGGGGNNVKQGDMEVALLDCSREVDVHMSAEGGNMSCVDCHGDANHQIKGKLYTISSMDRNRVTCIECHTALPHDERTLNKHTAKISCQTCHIPTYAKVNSTKTSWDWSTAGKLKDGQPCHEKDSLGNHTYLSIKGSFEWGRNLQPEYTWFNGTAGHYLVGDQINPDQVVQMNSLNGNYRDLNAKIVPVKVHRAKIPYDTGRNVLIQPYLFSHNKGEGALWQDFNWEKACEKGMEKVGQAYSGHFGFVKSELYENINHMIAPKEQALSCVECHQKNGRLAGLTDFYLPGRDSNSIIDFTGKLLLILSLGGIAIHGSLRAFSASNLKRKKGRK